MKRNRTPLRQHIEVKNPDPETGLTAEEVRVRMEGGWSNRLPENAGRSETQIILANCLTFFNFVFILLAAILAVSGSSLKNMAFMGVVLCNTAIGCFQEIRAKRAVDKLTLIAAQQLSTLRDGNLISVRSDLLVRDDLVAFSSGHQICADGVLRTGQLQVNEALITGEEDAIIKLPGDTLRSGSFVVAGTGLAQLTQVGADAFAARLSAEAKADPKAAKSEMLRSLDRLIRIVGIVLIPVGLLLFWQEFKVLGLGLQISAESTVSALVGMIPEGLYLLTSIAMAASALKLTRSRVLVQDMNCIETLARVDVLCVDKTGTLTEAGMDVENVIPLTEETPERLESILCAFFSGIQPENETAKALTEMFAGESTWECTQRIPFRSDTKWSAAAFRGHGCFVLGAPEFTLGQRYAQIRDMVEAWTGKGYRVLLMSQYAATPGEFLEPGKLRPLALMVLSNRIRPQARQTLEYFAQQGVAIKVISGDNPLTVSQIAQRCGISGGENYADAACLESDEDLAEALDRCTVFGRVTPDQKKRLIRLLKEKGHTVAMTGDGVNDVLALKEASCSLAMASGAQAACQISQLVLLNSDFAAIPHIVGEGRRVINNIQRAATLFLVKNIFSLGLALLSLITAWPYPIIPIQLTMISSLTIGIPSFFLAMEPNYARFQGHFLRGVLRRAFPGGLTNILMVLLAQGLQNTFTLPAGQTATICTAILALVGLLVLFETCKPFDTFRKLIFAAVAVALVVCFAFFSGFFGFAIAGKGLVILLALLVITPGVFYAMGWLFDRGEKLYPRIKGRFHL